MMKDCRQLTAIYKHRVFPGLETLNQLLPFSCRSLGVHVSSIDSRITKHLCELPDVRKVYTKHQGGFAVAWIAGVRCGVTSP